MSPIAQEPQRLLIRGTGTPTTLYAHGFGGGIADTRPFARGIGGTNAFLQFPGHGGRPSSGPQWTYAGLADELEAALRETAATRALGVSMGSGALLRLLAERRVELERAVIVLPPALDVPAVTDPDADTPVARRLARLRGAVEHGDHEAAAAALADDLPASVQQIPEARAWFAQRARALVETDQSDGLSLITQAPVRDAAALAGVETPVLVLTHEDDPAHPVTAAEQVAGALPNAELVVLPAGSILWLGRAAVEETLRGFLAD